MKKLKNASLLILLICCLFALLYYVAEGGSEARAEGLQLPTAAKHCANCHDPAPGMGPLPKVFKHAPGSKVPDSMDIPSEFPLGPGRTLTCDTCHKMPQGSDDEIENKLMEDTHEREAFLRKSAQKSEICVSCHKDKSYESDSATYGLNHMIIDIAIDPDSQGKKISAAGGKFGAEGEVLCNTCHKVHGSDNKFMNSVNVLDSSLCLDCHLDKNPAENKTHPIDKKIRDGRGSLPGGGEFGPGKKVECISCHRPHNAPGDGSLLGSKNPYNKTCKVCHSSKRGVLNSLHVFDSEGCNECHDVHAPTSNKLFKLERHGSGTYGACRACHNYDGPADSKVIAIGTSHPLGRKTNEAGERIYVGCRSCHYPHSPARGSAWTQFVRPNKEDSNMCFICHTEKVDIKDSAHSVLEDDEARLCFGCHNVHHVKDKRNLMKRASKEPKDTEVMNRQCLNCHNPDGLAQAVENYSHPEDIIAPESESGDGKYDFNAPRVYDGNGKLVPPGEMGKLTCSVCHNPHYGNSPTGQYRRNPEVVKQICVNCHDEDADNKYSKFHTKEVRQQ